MTLSGSIDEETTRVLLTKAISERSALSEELFQRTIVIERKRTERSGSPFLLMLLDSGTHKPSEEVSKTLDGVISALMLSTRETDVIGWYKDRVTIGALFTGLISENKSAAMGAILDRISVTLRDSLGTEQFNQISMSFHFYPETWSDDMHDDDPNAALYPDMVSRDRSRQIQVRLKRMIDIAGSGIGLLLCSPLWLMIALAIKVSSKGPVLFKQQRVGQHGRCFTFLKFRSMYLNNDPCVHQEYVRSLITGQIDGTKSSSEGSVYKLTNDRRITRVGSLLRRTSLDELPQLLNVLRGDMSLVGPRPPIPYEVAVYQTWHLRRVLEVKPGITGLWQVNGRSRVKFDDMVRLDLRYARSWSPLLDIKILLLTPRAVLMGNGAY